MVELQLHAALAQADGPLRVIPWWKGAVLYQIYPRSFLDSNGDGIGDLPGITAKLAYVASLGVDGIWLSPFFTSPMKDFGYDVADYCDVDPIFGRPEDFSELLRVAHGLGLRVIIDQVWSHTSDQHVWFGESRAGRTGSRSDWYVWADAKLDGTPPNNWLARFGGPSWTWDGRRRQYYFHNYLPSQPDLNCRNPAVQEAIHRIARFWLDLGVDGFRLDTANSYMHDPMLRDNPLKPGHDGAVPYNFQAHIHNKSHPDNLAFMEAIRRTLDAYPGERVAVAEIGDEDNLARMAEYTASGRLHTAYSFVFLRNPLSPRFVRDNVERFFSATDEPWPCWAFSNHDVTRIASRGGPDDPALRPAFAQMMNALLLTLRGTVFLYQGEELGLPHSMVPRERLVDPEGLANWPSHLNRDGARVPMPWQAGVPQAGFSPVEPWLPVDAAQAAIAVDVQEADLDSTLHLTRALLAWRKARPKLVTAPIRFLQADDAVLVFDRLLERGAIRCGFNMSGTAVSSPLPMGPVQIGRCVDAGADGIRLQPYAFALGAAA